MPKRTEAPELRKQRALEATDKHQTDVTVWTDGFVQVSTKWWRRNFPNRQLAEHLT